MVDVSADGVKYSSILFGALVLAPLDGYSFGVTVVVVLAEEAAAHFTQYGPVVLLLADGFTLRALQIIQAYSD